MAWSLLATYFEPIVTTYSILAYFFLPLIFNLSYSLEASIPQYHQKKSVQIAVRSCTPLFSPQHFSRSALALV